MCCARASGRVWQEAPPSVRPGCSEAPAWRETCGCVCVGWGWRAANTQLGHEGCSEAPAWQCRVSVGIHPDRRKCGYYVQLTDLKHPQGIVWVANLHDADRAEHLGLAWKHAHTCTHIHITHACACMHACSHTHTHVHTHMHARTRTHAHTHNHTHIHTSAFVCGDMRFRSASKRPDPSASIKETG